MRSRRRDGTLYNEPCKRGKKAEPDDPPPAGPVAVGAPAPVLYPPPPPTCCAPALHVAWGPWARASLE